MDTGDRAALVAAFTAARDAGDVDAMVAAALALPSSQQFGVHPGQIPALLHEAYEATDDQSTRCRLAAALARSWVYGGDAARAARFVAEAQRLADEVGTPDAMADALDAALLADWGPDDFAERVSLAGQLDEISSHLTDPERRLGAHLWRLTTAWECLDVVAVHRQLRALDLVAEESGSMRAAFFAASRRAMHTIAVDDIDSADHFIARTTALAAQLDEPDAAAVLHELRAMRGLAAGDLVALREEAESHEEFGTSEGIASITADAAVLWLAAGQVDRATALVGHVVAAGVGAVPRDVDFLLTMSAVTWVAAAIGLDEVAHDGARALEPYAGRAVINAGAVAFHGVVDDFVYRAHRALDTSDAARWLHAAETAYERVGARWWARQLGGARRPRPAPSALVVHLEHHEGGWTVGEDANTFTLPDLRGLHYVRYLVDRPGVDVDALALSDAAAGHPGESVVEGDLGEALDAKALASYRTRLVELDDLLNDADARGDAAAAVRLGEERDALLAELRSASGLGGRPRRGSGASTERARVAVRKAIATALGHIETHDPSVARLLRDSVRTGTTCRYDPNPDRPVRWL